MLTCTRRAASCFGEVHMAAAFPVTRLRRLRRTESLRALVRETAVTPSDLIQPIFVEEDIDEPLPIAEMPGVARLPERKLEPRRGPGAEVG